MFIEGGKFYILHQNLIWYGQSSFILTKKEKKYKIILFVEWDWKNVDDGGGFEGTIKSLNLFVLHFTIAERTHSEL